jgi:hypothetical protein
MENDSPFSKTTSRAELGITNAKAFLTTLAAQVYAASTIDSDNDGDISTSEWTNFGTQLILAVLGNFSVARNAFPEFGDIKGDEYGELVAHVLKTDFLPDDDDKAEDLVKTILVLAYVNRIGVMNIQASLQGEAPDTNILDVFQAIINLEKA